MKPTFSLLHKSLTLVLAAGLTATLYTMPARAAEAEDPSSMDLMSYFPADIQNHWAQNDLADLILARTLQGSEEDGAILIRPDSSVTRAEFVAILMRAMGSDAAAASADPGFDDVKPDAWYYHTVAAAKQLGLVNGADGHSFQPDRSITRAEIATVLVRALKDTVNFEGQTEPFPDTAGHWAEKEIQAAANAGIIEGYEDGTFGPMAAATRAEAAVMVSRGMGAEAGHLPSDDELIGRVESIRQTEMDTFNSGNVSDAAAKLPDQYGGFMLAVETMGLDSYMQMVEEGTPVKLSLEGAAKWTVLAKTDRYAALQSSGQQIRTLIGEGDQATENVRSTDDILLLRKTGEHWIIYGSLGDYRAMLKMLGYTE